MTRWTASPYQPHLARITLKGSLSLHAALQVATLWGMVNLKTALVSGNKNTVIFHYTCELIENHDFMACYNPIESFYNEVCFLSFKTLLNYPSTLSSLKWAWYNQLKRPEQHQVDD